VAEVEIDVGDSPLTFDEFRAHLAGIFQVPAESLSPETRFLQDLSFDSLRMLQLAMTFEDFHVEMPPEMAWEIETVGDAYAYCIAAGASPTAASPPDS
jgi:acyl carrier protein